MISFLDSRLTTDYFKFGHYLGLNVDLLHHIWQRNSHNPKHCITEVLLQWRKHSPDDSHECVVKALKASGYDLLSAMVTHRYSKQYSQKNHGPAINDSELLSHVLGGKPT